MNSTTNFNDQYIFLNKKFKQNDSTISTLDAFSPLLPSVCYHVATLSPFPMHVQFLFFIFYCTTIVASIVGNASVLLVHSRLLVANSSGALSYGGNSHNIYRYINNLAVSDLMLSVLSVPFTFTNVVTGYWPYSAWLCPAAQYFQVFFKYIKKNLIKNVFF